jgi:hypothetical protein
VDFVPPRPEDVVSLMRGLCAMSARGRNAAFSGALVDQVVRYSTNQPRAAGIQINYKF